MYSMNGMEDMEPGDIIWTYCGICIDRTQHLYQPDQTPPLKCLEKWHELRAATLAENKQLKEEQEAKVGKTRKVQRP